MRQTTTTCATTRGASPALARGASPQHGALFRRRYCVRSHPLRIMASVAQGRNDRSPSIAAVEIELS
jgi:hypothetical protein